MNKQWIHEDTEEAFFEWWEKVEPYKDRYSIRMIFDAGYRAGRESK